MIGYNIQFVVNSLIINSKLLATNLNVVKSILIIVVVVSSVLFYLYSKCKLKIEKKNLKKGLNKCG